MFLKLEYSPLILKTFPELLPISAPIPPETGAKIIPSIISKPAALDWGSLSVICEYTPMEILDNAPTKKPM